MKRILWLVAVVGLALLPMSAMAKPGIMPTMSAIEQTNIYQLKQDTAEGRAKLDPLPIRCPLPASAIGGTSSGRE